MSKLTRYLFGQPEGSLCILTKENLLLSLTFTLILSGGTNDGHIGYSLSSRNQ